MTSVLQLGRFSFNREKILASVKVILIAVLVGFAWSTVPMMFWHSINSREGRTIFATTWFIAWIVIAMIASFQKWIPMTGRLFLWLLAAPLGFLYLLLLAGNSLP